jgi:hypothetical protein
LRQSVDEKCAKKEIKTTGATKNLQATPANSRISTTPTRRSQLAQGGHRQTATVGHKAMKKSPHRDSSTKKTVKTSKPRKLESGPSPLKPQSGIEAESPLHAPGDRSSQGGHGDAAGTPIEKTKKKPASPPSVDVVQKVDNWYEIDDLVYPGIELMPRTTDGMLIAAFKFFCDPVVEKKVEEHVVIGKRQIFVMELATINLSDVLDKTSQSDQLLELLQDAIYETSNYEVMDALDEQTRMPELTPRLYPHSEVTHLLESQRKEVERYVAEKALLSLSLHDERKPIEESKLQTCSDVLSDDMKADLLLFCYRRIPKATIDSTVLKTIETENIDLWKKWQFLLREEKKRMLKRQRNTEALFASAEV